MSIDSSAGETRCEPECMLLPVTSMHPDTCGMYQTLLLGHRGSSQGGLRGAVGADRVCDHEGSGEGREGRGEADR